MVDSAKVQTLSLQLVVTIVSLLGAVTSHCHKEPNLNEHIPLLELALPRFRVLDHIENSYALATIQ